MEPIVLDFETLNRLQRNLLMFYLGGTRAAGSILREQSANMSESARFDGMVAMTELAEKLRSQLWAKRCDDFGAILDQAWRLKRVVASGVSNDVIDAVYERALKAGALGGKLLGAGGNGFMLFYCPVEKQEDLRRALSDLRPFPFRFDMEGSRVVFVGES